MQLASLSALLLAVLGAPALASNADEWESLDRQIEELAGAAARSPDDGANLNGFIRVLALDTEGVSGGDSQGVFLQDARINYDQRLGNVTTRIAIDTGPSGMRLIDAFAFVPLTQSTRLQVGRFRSQFLFSANVLAPLQVLFQRTRLGVGFVPRDHGVGFEAAWEPLLVYLQAFDGGDGAGDELLLTAKAWLTLRGGALTPQSGGYGPDADTSFHLGLGHLDDASFDDASASVLEAILVTGPVYAHVELVDVDDGFAGVTGGAAGQAAPFAGGTPLSSTVELMFDERWSAIQRYQDDDDAESTSSLTAGINHYIHGHTTKWQLAYTRVDSDLASNELERFELGFVFQPL